MQLSDTGRRMFFEELSKTMRKTVTVIMLDGKTYTGTLEGCSPETMSVCLINVKDDKGKAFPKIFLNGSVVAQILAAEKPFDLKGLADRLERVFPRMVRTYDDIGVIVVMDKIRVDASGLLEGTGPAAERVKKVYDEFMKELEEA
jgi:small nuclear ribonucleoprotein (snRNP)-like protein